MTRREHSARRDRRDIERGRDPRNPHRRPRNGSGGHIYGPSVDDIADALDKLVNHEIPGTPRLKPVKLVQDAMSLPVAVGDRIIKEVEIESGQPRHGAMRSDDHISYYRVQFAKFCPECQHQVAEYVYSSYHHIAGSQSITCTRCDHEYMNEEWG